MDDLSKILLTASVTVIGGVLVFVIGQLVGKFIIEPIHDLKKVLGKIRYALILHAPAIHTPVGDRKSEDNAASSLRELSCELLASVSAIPFYQLWSAWSKNFLPSKKDAKQAATRLIGLSNSVHQQDRSENLDIVTSIERLLGFDPVE